MNRTSHDPVVVPAENGVEMDDWCRGVRRCPQSLVCSLGKGDSALEMPVGRRLSHRVNLLSHSYGNLFAALIIDEEGAGALDENSLFLRTDSTQVKSERFAEDGQQNPPRLGFTNVTMNFAFPSGSPTMIC